MPTCLPTSRTGSISIPQVLPHGGIIPFENDLNTPSISQVQWRCRRGTLELDIWLMRYVNTCFELANNREQLLFLTLLDLPDPELSAYLSGQKIMTDPNSADLINKIRTL